MKKRYGSLYTLPLGLWVTVFFVIPIAIVLVFAFLTKGAYGGVKLPFTLEAFEALFKNSFLIVSLRTLLIALLSTVITILIALPVSYYLARTKNNTTLLLLVIIPFWVNFLIRIYAWIAILGSEGFINDILRNLGFLAPGDSIQFLFNFWTVVIVHVYSFLPYAILPLFSTIEKFDFNLLEAARDLGATHSRSLRSVLLPNIKGGIVTAILFTFIPTLGSYAIPDLVGSTDTAMLGNLIAYNIKTANNWPLASSLSLVLTILTSIGLLVYFFMNRVQHRVALREEAG